MKNIDLDLLNPGYEPIPKLPKKKRHQQRYHYVRVSDGYSTKSIGVKPQKMLDWRALERRHHQLLGLWKEANSEFWHSLKNVVRKPKKNEDKLVMIDEETAIVLSTRGGYSLESSARLVKGLMKDPKSRGDFFVVKPEEGGRELGRMLHRKDRLGRACGKYFFAFRKAISDRLEVFKRTLIEGDEVHYRAYYPEMSFLIKNDGRTHVVTMTSNGALTFHEGEVMECA